MPTCKSETQNLQPPTLIARLVLEICDRTQRECKSDDEIQEWMKRKFIVVLANTQRFQTEDYEN